MARKMKTMDGNHAAAQRILCVFRRRQLPMAITPSFCYGWKRQTNGQTQGRKKTFSRQDAQVTEMQSEVGAAGQYTAPLAAGALDDDIYGITGITADDSEPL